MTRLIKQSSDSNIVRGSKHPILAAGLFLMLPLAAALADFSINVTSSRSHIYLGESFNLTIEVNGADRDVGTPDLSGLQGAEVQFLGQHSNSRTSISIVNGHFSRDVFEGRVFAYQIKPAAQGTFQAGPIRISAAGKIHTHPGTTVQVAGIEKQDSVVASVTASSTSVLVEEPFTITLSVAIAELPDPYAENNEPIHPRNLPQISADFLEIKQDTPGLKGPDLNQLLNGLIDQSGRQPSFAINNYQTRDMGGFGNLFDDDPFRPRPIRFRLEPKRVTLNGKKYRNYTLSLNYTPTKEGEYTFGPLSFKGPIISDVTANRQAVTKDVYTIGPAVTVRVVPPPDEGRPEWFIGSVGKSLKATAAFDTTVCKVGDPLTLTLELTGPISISNMRTPILNLQPELTKDFRIYDENVTADTLPDGKRFKYRIRPTREGTLEFPAIKVSYYNTAAHAYATVSTAPIPVQAQATTQIATANESAASATASDAGAGAQPLPAAITLNADGARPAPLLPSGHLPLALLLGAPLVCLLASTVRPTIAGLRALQSRRRHSGALHRARSDLRRADAPDRAATAVRTYLTDRLDVPGSALTPSDVAALLRTRGVPGETAAACRDLLARLDEALYRPDASVSIPDIQRALLVTLERIDDTLNRSPRPAPTGNGTLLSLLLACVFLHGDARADDATTRQFLWEQANAQAAAAATPDAYINAAKTYNRLIAEGVENGPLFINLGDTLIMAGDGANAAAAFKRAERYLGSTLETRQGLLAASTLQTGHKQTDLPWLRTAFFWHFALPCSMRALTALGGWILFWVGVFFRIAARRRDATRHPLFASLSEACLVIGALTALIFAASTAVTLAHEHSDAATWPNRVFISSHPSDKEDAP